MNKVLEYSNAEAQKMCAHKDADMKYAAFKKRWVVIDETAKGQEFLEMDNFSDSNFVFVVRGHSITTWTR